MARRPIDPERQERARIVAASALATLALIALMLIIGAPKRVPPLQATPGLDATDIAGFQRNPMACAQALADARVGVSALAERREGSCRMTNAVELTRSLHPYSQPVATTCALAAALVVWERDVLLPAAQRRLGTTIARIELAAPAYQCRSIAGRLDRRMSEHASANAIDIAGFTLADGRVITVAQGWRGPDRAFLHDVRDGACRVFQAVLSPDYNAAHHDHLHFDLGRDKMCR